MEGQGGLPPPSGNHVRKRKEVKPQQFTNRDRTFSNGSTRGAFGPMPVQDAHKQHDKIYEVQTAAMKGNYRNINKKTPPRNAHTGHSHYRPDEEVGANDHPFFRDNRQTHSPRKHERQGTSDSNLVFSHHEPTREDLILRAEREKEMEKFSSMIAVSSGKNNKYSHYGTQENSWEQGEDMSEGYSFDDEYFFDDPSFFQQMFRTLIYDYTKPEFTSSQQNVWAAIIGIMMGIFTAVWGIAVEMSVEFVWATIPEYLLEQGVFTDLHGRLPLPHYFWICPAIFGGILSYITAKYAEKEITIPGQNEWIESLHRVGVMDHSRFIPVVVMSTLGMASGLSLGPEMPLVLASGMVGSWIALKTKQSVLSSRVLNLTASAAAIGGFFGFPMGGALFVLELPHRMGLQYFEALSPCVIASIVSVIVNRLVTQKHVEGYFDYPFLDKSLPSDIYWTAIIYGIFGTFVGWLYAEGCLFCKHWVHDWFHAPHDDHSHAPHHDEDEHKNEKSALIGDSMFSEDTLVEKHSKSSICKRMSTAYSNFFAIHHEPTRAAVAGVMVGIVVGLMCMFLPHQLFWGEAQLQTLIDRGKTPLPVFEYEGPTSIMTAYGYCMVDPNDAREQIKGFSTACIGMLSFTKILTIGLSLGTGVCGGHFWGPLYVGCAAGHFFTDLCGMLPVEIPYVSQCAMFPCLAVICIMGATHVVTYRCHMAIMLVLTLTITSFTNETKESPMAGDYSAIFPLLVVACFVPLLLARDTTFYGKQRSRGDIVAIPEVLCEPNKEGRAFDYEYEDSISGSQFSYEDDSGSDLSEDDSIGDGNEMISTSKDVDVIAPPVHNRTTSAGSSVKPRNLDGTEHSSISKASSSRRKLSSTDVGVPRPSHVARQSSYGMVEDLQPTLLDQSRHAATAAIPKHRRTGSSMSQRSNMDSSRHSSRGMDLSRHSSRG